MKTQRRTLAWRASYTAQRIAVILLLCSQLATAAKFPGDQPAVYHLETGLQAFQRGDFARAAGSWQQARELYAAAGNVGRQVDALLHLADAYQALGQYRRQSLQSLQHAWELASESANNAQLAGIRGSLGQVYFLLGAADEASEHLDASIALAREIGDGEVLAASLNKLGNLLTTNERYQEALEVYGESAALARQAGNDILAVKALINAAKAAVQAGRYAEAESLLASALSQVQQQANSHNKAYALVSLGQLALTLYTVAPSTPRLSYVYQVFKRAADIANELDDWRVAAYAWGYLAQLYERQRQYQDALNLSRRAAFAAQQTGAPEISYRWQWQIGRLLKAQGDRDGAISAYRRATFSLQSVGRALYPDQLTSATAAESVFSELADLLLQRSSKIKDPQQKEQHLVEARDAMERLKTAELTNYFRDDCAVALQSRTVRLERPDSKTAIV